MSLTDWVDWDKELIDHLFDKPSIQLPRTLQVKAPPLTLSYATVGTAFDYALRLRVAKLNVELIGIESFHAVADNGASSGKQWNFIESFDGKRRKFMKGELEIRNLLYDCLVLAKIESQYRSGQELSDGDIFSISEEDETDLNNLINLVDDGMFRASKRCELNPTFGQSSLDIGGADADLIIDGLLIDIKTTKYLKLERRMWRQLVGYWILNVREGEMYGEIEQLSVYFSRFGYLCSFPVPKDFYYLDKQDGRTLDMMDAVEESIKEYQKADIAP